MNLVTAFIAAAALFLLAILGLSIGVLLGRRPLRGSCGGLSAMASGRDPGDEAGPCTLCGLDLEDCPKKKAKVTETAAGAGDDDPP